MAATELRREIGAGAAHLTPGRGARPQGRRRCGTAAGGPGHRPDSGAPVLDPDPDPAYGAERSSPSSVLERPDRTVGTERLRECPENDSGTNCGRSELSRPGDAIL